MNTHMNTTGRYWLVQVSVEGVSPDQYLERFSWNEAKYPPRRPLSETVSTITETIQRLEDDLKVSHSVSSCLELKQSKRNDAARSPIVQPCSNYGGMQVRMSEYNQLKGQVTAAARKQTGSLAVRDLTGLIKPTDAVNTENLITLFTVVSKHDKAEWLTTYETLADFVVRTHAVTKYCTGLCFQMNLQGRDCSNVHLVFSVEPLESFSSDMWCPGAAVVKADL